MKINVKFKVWIEVDGKPVIGKGGISLLEEIKKEGSLRRACIKLNYPYSFAWNYIKRAEKNLGVKLVVFKRGGAGGGSATLTREAVSIIRIYNELISEMRKIAERYSEIFSSELKIR